MSDFKPTGYTSVAPYLIVDGAQGTIDFLKQVFDAEQRGGFRDAVGAKCNGRSFVLHHPP